MKTPRCGDEDTQDGPGERLFRFSVDCRRPAPAQVGFTSDRKALAQAVDAATQPVKTRPGTAAQPTSPKTTHCRAQTGADRSGKPVGAEVRARICDTFGASRLRKMRWINTFGLSWRLWLCAIQQQMTQRRRLSFSLPSTEGRSIHAQGMQSNPSSDRESSRRDIYVVDLSSVICSHLETYVLQT